MELTIQAQVPHTAHGVTGTRIVSDSKVVTPKEASGRELPSTHANLNEEVHPHFPPTLRRGDEENGQLAAKSLSTVAEQNVTEAIKIAMNTFMVHGNELNGVVTQMTTLVDKLSASCPGNSIVASNVNDVTNNNAESSNLATAMVAMFTNALNLVNAMSQDSMAVQQALSGANAQEITLSAITVHDEQLALQNEIATQVAVLTGQLQTSISTLNHKIAEQRDTWWHSLVEGFVGALAIVAGSVLEVCSLVTFGATSIPGTLAILGGITAISAAAYGGIANAESIAELRSSVNVIQNKIQNLQSESLTPADLLTGLQQAIDQFNSTINAIVSAAQDASDVGSIISDVSMVLMAVGSLGALAACTTVVGAMAMLTLVTLPALSGLTGNLMRTIGQFNNNSNLQNLGGDVSSYGSPDYWIADGITQLLAKMDPNMGANTQQMLTQILSVIVQIAFTIIAMKVTMSLDSAKASSDTTADDSIVNAIKNKFSQLTSKIDELMDKTTIESPALASLRTQVLSLLNNETFMGKLVLGGSLAAGVTMLPETTLNITTMTSQVFQQIVNAIQQQNTKEAQIATSRDDQQYQAANAVISAQSKQEFTASQQLEKTIETVMQTLSHLVSLLMQYMDPMDSNAIHNNS